MAEVQTLVAPSPLPPRRGGPPRASTARGCRWCWPCWSGAAGSRWPRTTYSPRRSAGCAWWTPPRTWPWRWRWPRRPSTPALPPNVVAIGEVGLAGEVRPGLRAWSGGWPRRPGSAFARALVPPGRRRADPERAKPPDRDASKSSARRCARHPTGGPRRPRSLTPSTKADPITDDRAGRIHDPGAAIRRTATSG